jgi:hypothetical protein
MRITSFIAAFALGAPLAFGADAVHEAGADLHHADGGYLPNAAGNVGIREGSDFQRFTVTVREVGGDATLIVQLGTEHDQFVDVGTMAATAAGRILNLTTLEGGHLPLDVAAVHELSGHAVRVVDGDHHPVLVGTVPTFDATQPPQDPPPHDPPPQDPPPTTDHPPADITARADMVRPEDSPYDDSRGVIVAIKRADSEALRIEVGHLAPATHYVVFLGDDHGGTQIGDFTANDNGGALMTRDTAAGDELPLGASLADLAGRHVEVRHEGVVVLLGAIPHVDAQQDVAPVHQDVREQDASSGATVRVIVDIHPRVGRESCDVRMSHLPTDEAPATDPTTDGGTARAAPRRATADLYMDDGAGTMRLVGSARIGRGGRARLLFVTRRGGSLPLSAATLRELAGRALEVRVNGTTRVASTMPGI